MKETNDKSIRYDIKRLLSFCELFAAGSLVGIVVFLKKIDGYIRIAEESRDAVSHGYATLFSYSVTTVSGKAFHGFNWGAIALFLLIGTLILLEAAVTAEQDNKSQKQPE